jgi:hypothetical protein
LWLHSRVFHKYCSQVLVSRTKYCFQVLSLMYPAAQRNSSVDIGLAVRSAARGLCVPGYVTPSQDGGGWSYSMSMGDMLQEYQDKFPWILAALEAK